MTWGALLQSITAAVRGVGPDGDLPVLRKEANQVLLAARASLENPDAENPVGLNVPSVEVVIASLLPYCPATSSTDTRTRSMVSHAHHLISGTHSSRHYPPRRRLRILLYSARQLLVLARPAPAIDTPAGLPAPGTPSTAATSAPNSPPP